MGHFYHLFDFMIERFIMVTYQYPSKFELLKGSELTKQSCKVRNRVLEMINGAQAQGHFLQDFGFCLSVIPWN